MVLTNRDLRLFALISKTAILTTEQIGSKIFQGVAITTVLRRLRKLEVQKYMQRLLGLPNYEVAWHLTKKSAEVIGCQNPKTNFHRLNQTHDVKLNSLRFVLEDHGVARSWIPEHEIRSAMARRHGLARMKSKSVPDGIMGVSYDGSMESIAIELELNYKNKDRYRDIFWSYREKNNLLGVWYFVPTKSLGQHLTRLWEKHVGRDVRPWLFWSLVDDVELNGSNAHVHYFEKASAIKNMFDLKNEPAHTSGFGVSKQGEDAFENKINSTPQDETENLDQAS